MIKQRRTIHQVLADARARYRRLEPQEAFAAMQTGAVLIDTRTDRQRRRDGDIPGAVVIDRTVLEWRVDPASEATHPAIVSLEVPLILPQTKRPPAPRDSCPRAGPVGTDQPIVLLTRLHNAGEPPLPTGSWPSRLAARTP